MENLLTRITINPKQLAGKPTIRGMRISVEQILNDLAKGMSVNEILANFPVLEANDIKASLLYASQVIESEITIPVTS